MNPFAIKVLSDSDWPEYKSIRLESLQDSPDSFGSTYERESAFTTEQWKSRLSAASTSSMALTLAAVTDQRFIGLVSGVIHKPDTHHAHLYQMWVDPEYRGLGVGSALFDRVRSWAADRNINKILLSVSTTNVAAISLYRSIGFTPFGVKEPLRNGSDLQSQPMQIKLD